MSTNDPDHLEVREKNAALVEEQSQSDSNIEGDNELLAPGVRASAERKLVRKLDIRLMPTIIVIFIMNYIDVGNHSYNKSYALAYDLGSSAQCHNVREDAGFDAGS